MLLNQPGFSAVIVLSLALGIGVNSAIFSFADALLLRPLPVLRPAEVVTLSGTSPDTPLGAFGSASYPDYADFRDKAKAFSGLVAFTVAQVGLTEAPDALPQFKAAMAVSGNLFQVMGVEPVLGRGFSPEEDRVPGRDAVLVLGHDAWQKRFAADPKVLDRTIRVNGIEFKIIGVAPREFTGMDAFLRPDFFIPVMMLPRVAGQRASKLLEDRDDRRFIVKGRIRAGVSLAQARAESDAIARALEKEYPETNSKHGVAVRTELQVRVDQSPPQAALAAMLLGIAGLVLLIACANVANLLLSRARSRSREIGVRLAIGAGRVRLLRQLLTESLILALAGGALGLFLADFGVDYFSKIQIPTDLPVSLTVRLDQRVLLFSLIAAVASAFLFGLAPAIQSARTDVLSVLRIGETDVSRRRTAGRSALAIAQVALSLMLLVVASLFFREFQATLLESPGFRTDHLLMLSFDPTLVHYTSAKTRAFYRMLVERARQMPGVRNATVSETIPFGSSVASLEIAPEGYQPAAGREGDAVFCNTADERYFDTIGTPILRGRGFAVTDTALSPRVAVINEALANRYWPGKDPLGKRFRLNGGGGPWVEVVGVARMAKYVFIAENPTPYFYLPLAQNPRARLTLLVETAGDAASFADPIRHLVRSVDPHQPVYDLRTMDQYYRQRGLGVFRMIVEVVGSIGILGLSLALIGLYGLVAYRVSRRTREIGIRMAVGAQSRDILRMVLRQGLTLALAGIGLGLCGSVGVVKGIGALYSRTDGAVFDPWGFIAVPVALFAVMMLACYIPARHAAGIDPNQALRHE
jgi:predicted permease